MSINDRLNELRRRFRERAQVQADELGQALRNNDLLRVRDIAHRLSGGGGTFGYAEISRLAEAVEGTAESQATTAELTQVVQSLVDAIGHLDQVV